MGSVVPAPRNCQRAMSLADDKLTMDGRHARSYDVAKDNIL